MLGLGLGVWTTFVMLSLFLGFVVENFQISTKLVKIEIFGIEVHF
jgi:hypothetical protein